MQYTSLWRWKAFINNNSLATYVYDGVHLRSSNLPIVLAGIPDVCLINGCFDRNSKRRQILCELGLAYRQAGWAPSEAAKRAQIKPEIMDDILNNRHWFLSNDDLIKITKAIEVTKPNFIYLDDIRKHLDFLYSYCDVANSGTLFGMPEQQILDLIESSWRPERGVPLKYISGDDGSFTIMEDEDKSIDDIPDLQAERAPVTLQALPELRTFSLAVTMLDFVETDRLHLMDRLIKKPYFTNEVFRVFHELSKIPDEERRESERLNRNAIQRGNAKLPRKPASKELARREILAWNNQPSLFKNKTKFKEHLTDEKKLCSMVTAEIWLNEFADELEKNSQLNATLKAKIQKKRKNV